MFSRLRLRLTFLYLFMALALIALIGVGVYRLLSDYFQSTTDLALQHKMAQEFQALGIPLPTELASADRDWYAHRNRQPPDAPNPSAPLTDRYHIPRDDEHEDFEDHAASDDAYDGDLAAIFVLPLTSEGHVSFDAPKGTHDSADRQAATAALLQGHDWRTVQADDGARVRLLTYRLPAGFGPAALQLGRTLAPQDRTLAMLLVWLAGLGSLSALLLGASSWWLAGRSLRPAQLAWERQQTFVANASHELRAPLTLLRASTEVALRSTPKHDTEQRELLQDVLQECDHMNILVEDLLLLSRLDAGQLKLERRPISLPDLIADVRRQVGRLADERTIRLITEETRGVAWGDPARLRQIILIVLDNALRHTPVGGSIRLSAQPRGRHISITITDTGEGIAPEHLAHIFERFYRVDSTRGSDGSNGNGLGLSIARALIEAQHGEITITSRLGSGTQLTILLPSAGETPEARPS